MYSFFIVCFIDLVQSTQASNDFFRVLFSPKLREAYNVYGSDLAGITFCQYIVLVKTVHQMNPP